MDFFICFNRFCINRGWFCRSWGRFFFWVSGVEDGIEEVGIFIGGFIFGIFWSGILYGGIVAVFWLDGGWFCMFFGVWEDWEVVMCGIVDGFIECICEVVVFMLWFIGWVDVFEKGGRFLFIEVGIGFFILCCVILDCFSYSIFVGVGVSVVVLGGFCIMGWS